MGISEKKTNIAKWGIPEKSIKNAAQKRWIKFRRTFHSKVTRQVSYLAQLYGDYGLKLHGDQESKWFHPWGPTSRKLSYPNRHA